MPSNLGSQPWIPGSGLSVGAVGDNLRCCWVVLVSGGHSSCGKGRDLSLIQANRFYASAFPHIPMFCKAAFPSFFLASPPPSPKVLKVIPGPPRGKHQSLAGSLQNLPGLLVLTTTTTTP